MKQPKNDGKLSPTTTQAQGGPERAVAADGQVHLLHRERVRGCFDVLFSNQKGEITEGSRTNLFIKKGDTFYTPPIECGLLDGIYRRQILDDENIKSVEKILFFEDLRSAEQLYLCNSVRGLIPVSLIGH